jgi:uncharacterized protein YndB with AHSA1/START domain
MRSPEGVDQIKRGIYREIVSPERIVFTFAWEAPDGSLGTELLVTVTLETLGAKTRLTLQQSGFDAVETRLATRTSSAGRVASSASRNT